MAFHAEWGRLVSHPRRSVEASCGSSQQVLLFRKDPQEMARGCWIFQILGRTLPVGLQCDGEKRDEIWQRVGAAGYSRGYVLMASLWFPSAHPLRIQALVGRGPQALARSLSRSCSWQEMKGSGKRAWCLRAGGGLGNRLCVCPSTGCLLSFPSPPPPPLRGPLLLPPGRDRRLQAREKSRCLGCQGAPRP